MTTYDASDMECGELLGCCECQSVEPVKITTFGWAVVVTCGECGSHFFEIE